MSHKSSLNIVENDENKNPPSPSRYSDSQFSTELRAKLERLWLKDPEQFNPLRNCMERERLKRTWDILIENHSINETMVADIGCGSGVFSRRMAEHGAHVEAVDIAENALRELRKHSLERIQSRREAMPATTLPDKFFDLIICTELIAWLPREKFRIFFAELSRIIKPEGQVIFSTPIDIYTEGGKKHLLDFAQTEFDIVALSQSYHSLYLRILHFFQRPDQFLESRKRHLKAKQGVNYLFYLIFSTTLLPFCFIFSLIFKPFLKILKQNRSVLLGLEKICRWFSGQDGVSHVIVIGKQRPIVPVKEEEIPIEHPKKRQIWE